MTQTSCRCLHSRKCLPDEKAGLEEETRKAEEEMTRTIKVKDKPVRKPLDTSLLPVKEINLYPEGTAGGLKDDFVEIGTEETLRLERIPEKSLYSKDYPPQGNKKIRTQGKAPGREAYPYQSASFGSCGQMYSRSIRTDRHYHRKVHVSSAILPPYKTVP